MLQIRRDQLIFIVSCCLGLILCSLQAEIHVEAQVTRRLVRDLAVTAPVEEKTWNNLSPFQTTLEISGQTHFPTGTWLILSLLYQNQHLSPTTREIEVKTHGLFSAVLGPFEGAQKLFAGVYQVEVLFLPKRQPYTLHAALATYSEEKALVSVPVGSKADQQTEGLELLLFMERILTQVNNVHQDLWTEAQKFYPKGTPERLRELRTDHRTCLGEFCFDPDKTYTDFDPDHWGLFLFSWEKKVNALIQETKTLDEQCLVNPYFKSAYKMEKLSRLLLTMETPLTRALNGDTSVSLNPLQTNFQNLYQGLVKEIDLQKDGEVDRKLHNLVQILFILFDQMESRYTPPSPNWLPKVIEALQKKEIREREEKFLESLYARFKTDVSSPFSQTLYKSYFLKRYPAIRRHLQTTIQRWQETYRFLRAFIEKSDQEKTSFLSEWRIQRGTFLRSMAYLLISLQWEDVYVGAHLDQRLQSLGSSLTPAETPASVQNGKRLPSK